MRPTPPATMLLLASLFAGASVVAQHSVQLRVTATIPPRPCDYPQACKPVPPGTTSKVTITGESVSYLGSTPEVSREGELLIVKF